MGGVAHPHSEYATAGAQPRREIPCFGTTHADYFHGPVPVTEPMPDHEIAGEYEENTGTAILRAFRDGSPASLPGVLVANHGPFAWGKDVAAAPQNAVILAAISRMTYFTASLYQQATPILS